MNYHVNDKTKVLGAGAFGKVFMTTNKHDSNFKVAIKVLDKNKLGFNLDLIMDEVNTLNKLDHPNIVKYFETYNDVKYIYLVMEYIKGMPLFDKITHQAN
jgi:serine/threonine protein kinase